MMTGAALSAGALAPIGFEKMRAPDTRKSKRG